LKIYLRSNEPDGTLSTFNPWSMPSKPIDWSQASAHLDYYLLASRVSLASRPAPVCNWSLSRPYSRKGYSRARGPGWIFRGRCFLLEPFQFLANARQPTGALVEPAADSRFPLLLAHLSLPGQALAAGVNLCWFWHLLLARRCVPVDLEGSITF